MCLVLLGSSFFAKAVYACIHSLTHTLCTATMTISLHLMHHEYVQAQLECKFACLQASKQPLIVSNQPADPAHHHIGTPSMLIVIISP